MAPYVLLSNQQFNKQFHFHDSCSGAPGFKITENQRQTGKKNYENFAPAIIA